MSLRAIVADDEALARNELVYLLEASPEVTVIDETANGPDTLASIRKNRPDLLFLDIQMPGLTGFQVVERCARVSHPPAVIFVTAYDQYAIDAFKVNAIDYLLKPVDEARLAEAIARAAERIRAGQTSDFLSRAAGIVESLGRTTRPAARLTVRQGGRIRLVECRTVYYARMADGVIEVHGDGVRGTSNIRTLDELENTLGSSSFFRAHRGYLVNLDHVDEVIPWFSGRYKLRMTDEKGTEITVSRARSKILKDLLKL